eukprot:5082819-Alexandrium_andersonii.AAC.1
MSASLVGSEMCIRDRLSGSVESSPEIFGALWSSGENCGALQRSRRLSGCLLYTSDAADDM